MKITYDNWLTVKEAEALKNAGWTLHLFTDSQFKTHGMVEPDGTFQGSLAMSAEKEFDSPSKAMFEVEEVLQVDVISETDQNGCPLHIFVWKQENGSDEIAIGWDCARIMFDAPTTARKAAIELKQLRAKI